MKEAQLGVEYTGWTEKIFVKALRAFSSPRSRALASVTGGSLSLLSGVEAQINLIQGDILAYIDDIAHAYAAAGAAVCYTILSELAQRFDLYLSKQQL